MSTILTNSTMQSNTINSTSPLTFNSQPQTPSPLPLISSTSLPSTPAPFNEDKHTEKFYKKGKQIFVEFDQLVKGMCKFSSHLLL